LRVSKLLERIWFRPRAARAQEYDEARAQLGGAAWADAPKSTDAWFAIDPHGGPGAQDDAHHRRAKIGYAVVLFAIAATVVGVASTSHGRTEPHPMVTAQATVALPPSVIPTPTAIPAADAPAEAAPSTTTVAQPAATTTIAAPTTAPLGRTHAKSHKRTKGAHR
jgi:hypothetical protein